MSKQAHEILLEHQLTMNYQYAWSEKEFVHSTFPTRFSSSIARLIYIIVRTRETQANLEHQPLPISSFSSNVTFLECIETCSSSFPQVSYQPYSPDLQLDALFVYVPPEDYESVDSMLEQLLRAHANALVWILLGDAELLPPSQDAEENRLRGLASFGLSKKLSPLLEQLEYETLGHFSCEFRHHDKYRTSTTSNERNQVRKSLNVSMNDAHLFTCNEHWLGIGSRTSPFVQATLAVLGNEQELQYWHNQQALHWCHECHGHYAKLFQCARCQVARYCSSACQKHHWKLHKALCKPKEVDK